ncbi:MAG TPA: hypothetical protein PKD09_07800 [Aggregatilinea sp.]|uniref:hypothetical protein n=1 Tax=Aggregatilinea sp. TaxID=2806333 RepID=UPI002B8C2064|nr:hypothetical protein [Aggregatilinea sp.]HML21533.1 hypothetical protein [Aggregatilinea sp.]
MTSSISSHALLSALLLYGVWTVATYLLEGRLRTLLRPEAIRLRLTYNVVANLLIGLLLAGWVLRALVVESDFDASKAGFADLPHALLAVAAALVLGVVFLFVQKLPSRHPIVLLNGFAQVWIVSAAEVMVCWAVVGTVAETRLNDSDVPVPVVLAALIAALLFGLYHAAHSPPFNTVPMIAKLTVVGLATSIFFFVSRDIYGTLVFHNFLALFGVLTSLGQAGVLQRYEKPIPPVLITALVSLALLVVVHIAWLA